MLLTTKQVAEMVGLSRSQIRRRIQDGLIKAQKMGMEFFIDEKLLPKIKRKRLPKRKKKKPTS